MTIKENSARDFTASNPQDREQINLGCMQRIATATEKMALNYDTLIRERNYYKEWYERERSKRQALERSNAALRAWITRLRRKLA